MTEEFVTQPDAPGGVHRDILRGPDGRVAWVRDWEHNVLADGLRAVLAALIKGDPNAVALASWAVGSGETIWDTEGPPPDATRATWTTLKHEVKRRQLAAGAIAFVGGAFTNRLEIISSFTTPDVPAGPLREFGLFAGGGATSGGVLINHRAHPRIDLQPGFTLERTLLLTF